MRRVAVVLGVTALVTACDGPLPGKVRYSVISHDAEIRSATLTLCDREVELRADAGVWSADVPIECEGGGHIFVRLADGAAVSCSGDYVSPDLRNETFGYVASSTGCAFAD